VYVNLENAVSVYWSERDKGTIIAFVGGEKDALTVQEKPEQILERSLPPFIVHEDRALPATSSVESALCQNRGALLKGVVIAFGQDDYCFWIRPT
jgi:hypothetical protein